MEPGRGPPPLRGQKAPSGGSRPGCPASRRGVCGVLGLGPPRLRWAAAGLARRPCLCLGLAPGLGPLAPVGPLGPGSGPLRSLGVAPGVAAAYRRAACAPRGGFAAPPGPGAAAPGGPGPRRPWPAVGSVPSSAGLARRLLSLAAPLSGGAALLPPAGCAPCLVLPGPPSAPPAGRPGFRPGPPPLVPPGGGWGGGSAAPLCRRRPPPWGHPPLFLGRGSGRGPGALPTPGDPRQGSRQAAQGPPLTEISRRGDREESGPARPGRSA